MMVNAVELELSLKTVSNPVLEGYLLSNQGKRIKYKVTTDGKKNIIFSPVEPIEEDDNCNSQAY